MTRPHALQALRMYLLKDERIFWRIYNMAYTNVVECAGPIALRAPAQDTPSCINPPLCPFLRIAEYYAQSDSNPIVRSGKEEELCASEQVKVEE